MDIKSWFSFFSLRSCRKIGVLSAVQKCSDSRRTANSMRAHTCEYVTELNLLANTEDGRFSTVPFSKTITVFIACILVLFAIACDNNGQFSANSSVSNEETDIAGLRTASSSTYQNPDGTRTTEFSSSPIHYYNDDAWQKIDTTLTTDIDDDDYDIGVEKSPINVFFKDTSASDSFLKSIIGDDTNQPYEMKIHAQGMSFVWQSRQLTIVSKDDDSLFNENAVKADRQVQGNKIIYANVFTTVDEEFIIEGNSVKHNVILNKSLGQFPGATHIAHSGELQLSPDIDIIVDGKRLVEEMPTDTNDFVIINRKTKKDIFFHMPMMFEHSGDEDVAGFYRLIRNKDSLTIQMVFDYQWLSDASRQFPVILDPSITLESSTQSRTGYIWGNNGSKNRSYSSTSGMKIGANNGNVNYYRGYAEWDISQLAEATSISSVKVRLRSRVWNDSNGDGSMSTRIYQMSRRPTSSTAQQIYDDVSDGRNYGYIQWYGNNRTYDFTFDSTERSHVFNNRGAGWFAVGLRLYEGVGDDSDSVYLHTNTTSSSYRPRLIVTYVAPSDGAGFSSESHVDGTDIEINTNFTKRWTLSNTGQTTWNSNYCIHYVSDNVSSGRLSTSTTPVCVSGTVSPGRTYAFRVTMRTPGSAQNGAREEWQLRKNGNTVINVGNSNSIWVNVDVTAPAPFSGPSLESPVNTDTGISRRTQLDWNSVSGATAYRVQVSTSSTFNSLVVNYAWGNSYYNIPSNTLNKNTRYYWRVRAGSNDRGGDWSTIRYFTTEKDQATLDGESHADYSASADIYPNTNFNKSWMIQNTGSTTWTSNYCIYYVDSTISGGRLSQSINPVCVSGTVSPNNIYTFTVSMQTPNSGTNLKDRWQLKDENNTVINVNGSAYFWALIDVKALPALSAPVLTSPGDNATAISRTHRLDWNSVSSATAYRVQVSTASNFSNMVIDHNTGNSTYYNIPSGTLNRNTTYYWRARAGNTNQGGDWPNEPRQFTTEIVSARLSSESHPDNNVDGADVPANSDFTKTWTIQNTGNRTWSGGYCIHFMSSNVPGGSLSQNTNATCISGSIAPQATYTFSVPMQTPASGTGLRDYWQLRDSYGDSILVSGSDQFWALIDVISDPCGTLNASLTVTTPNGGENWRRGNNYTVRWNEVGNISQLHIHLYKGNNFVYGLSNDAPNTGSFNFTLRSDTEPGSDYRIGISNAHADAQCNGTVADFSNSYFTISSDPSAVILVSPESGDGNVLRTVQLDWAPVSGTENYQVQVSPSSSFNSTVVDTMTSSNQTYYNIPSDTLNYSTLYHWRARAIDSLGSSAWSGIRTFTTRSQDQITALLHSETHEDDSVLNPRQRFTKRWTLQNNGNVSWTTAYYIRHISGSMSTSTQNIALGNAVAVGNRYTFSVTMNAPLSGQGEDHWQLVDHQGRVVTVSGSQTFYVRISVRASDSGNHSAQWVGETIADGTPFTPGSHFTKTWTLKNQGTDPWNNNFFLRRRAVATSLSQQQTLPISGTVSVGNNYTFTVAMTAPQSDGNYREEWEFVGPDGDLIQIREANNKWAITTIWADISVDRPSSPPDGMPTVDSGNPTIAEVNQEIHRLAEIHSIPPILLKAIAYKEGASGAKWKQYWPRAHSQSYGSCNKSYPYNTGDVVFGYDLNASCEVKSIGIGLMQITIPVSGDVSDRDNIQFSDPSHAQKMKGSWRMNLEEAARILNHNWSLNIDGFSGCDVDKRILENWYYPIAWYNGSGNAAYNYTTYVYNYMRDGDNIQSDINALMQHVPNVSWPRVIPGFSQTISRSPTNANEQCTLLDIVQNSGRIHRWTGGSNYADITSLVENGNCEASNGNELSIPLQVTGVTYSQNGDSIVLNWNSNSESESIQSYYAYWQKLDEDGNAVGQEIRSDPIMGTTILPNWTPGIYDVYIEALNNSGTGPRSKVIHCDYVGILDGPPTQVQNVNITVDESDVTVTWNATPGAIKYMLKWWKTNDGFFNLKGTESDIQNTQFISEFTSDGTYRVKVKACREEPGLLWGTKDVCSDSWSDDVEFTTPADGFDVSCTQLHNNKMLTNITISANDLQHYCFKLPAGMDVVTVQMGGDGLNVDIKEEDPYDADLYLKHGSPVENGDLGKQNDEASPILISPWLAGALESITVYDPPAGKYYVGVHGSAKMEQIPGNSLNYFIKLHFHGANREGLPSGFVLDPNAANKTFSPVNPADGNWYTVAAVCSDGTADPTWGPCNPSVTIDGSSGTGIVVPQEGEDNASCFQECRHPDPEKDKYSYHEFGDWDSVDFNMSEGAYADEGKNLYAVFSGTVIFKGDGGGYGNEVIIQSDIDGNFAARYAHMKDWHKDLKVGQHIEAGTVIGTIGKSGGDYYPHLHYSLHRNLILNQASGSSMNHEGLIKTVIDKVTGKRKTKLLSGRPPNIKYSAFTPLYIDGYLGLPDHTSTWTVVESRCPVDLQASDAEGRKIGKGAFGTMHFEIPEAEYYTVHAGPDTFQVIALPNAMVGSDYQVNVSGYNHGEFNVGISAPDIAPGHYDNLSYLNEPVTPDTSARFNISALNTDNPLIVQTNNDAYLPGVSFDEDNVAQFNMSAPHIDDISVRVLGVDDIVVITGSHFGSMENTLPGEIDLIQNTDIYRPFDIMSWQDDRIELKLTGSNVPVGEYMLRLMIYPSRLLSNKVDVDISLASEMPILYRANRIFALAGQNGLRAEFFGKHFSNQASVRIGGQQLQDAYIAGHNYIFGNLPALAIGDHLVTVSNGNENQSVENIIITYLDPLGDFDADGLSNEAEFAKHTDLSNADTDGDGVLDGADALPSNEMESSDADLDGIGDNADTDDDNDGTVDDLDDLPNDPNDLIDTDGDGVGDSRDQCQDTSQGANVDADGCAQGQLPLITDGNMDAPDMSAWTAHGVINENFSVLEKSSDQSVSGAQSMYIDARGTARENCGFKQMNISVLPGQWYQFKFDCKILSGQLRPRLGIDASSDFEHHSIALYSRPVWQGYTRQFKVPNDFSGSFNVIIDTKHGAEAYVDNIMIEAISQPLLIMDGDMEMHGVQSWRSYGTPTIKEKSTQEFTSGRQSIHINSQDGSGGIQQLHIPVSAGQWVHYSFKYKLLYGEVYSLLGIRNSDADFESRRTKIRTSSNEWQRFDRYVYIPDNYDNDFRIVIQTENADVYIDDIAMEYVSQPPLLPDGDMEMEGTGLWRTYDARSTLTKVNDIVYSGSQSIYVETTDEEEYNEGGVQQLYVNVVAGQQYRFSFWYQSVGSFNPRLGDSDSNDDFEFPFFDENGDLNIDAQFQPLWPVLSSTRTWTYYEREFIAPDTDDFRVIFNLYDGDVPESGFGWENYDYGQLWLDDVRIDIVE